LSTIRALPSVAMLAISAAISLSVSAVAPGRDVMSSPS
jgi:hypothetical protein